MVWVFITRNGMHRELVNYEFLDFCLVFACLIFLLAGILALHLEQADLRVASCQHSLCTDVSLAKLSGDQN